MLTDSPSALLILIVEDDQGHAELIERAFDDAADSYRLLFATTLKEARQVLQCHVPRLVLTDYRLPDGSGSELVTTAEGAWPVILMTSHGSEQLAVEALKAGVQDYIVKSPETFASLSRIVQRVLREWDMLQERREIEEAIHRAKHEWEQTFDAVPDLIAIIDGQQTITRANRAMAERYGCRTADLIGRKCYDVMHGAACVPNSCPHHRLLQDKQEHVQEIHEELLGRSFDISVSPLLDPAGNLKACVHVARDITARKKAEEERLLLEEQFRQAQKLESLGVLSGGIAHDFNNILSIILGHCFLIKDDRKTDDACRQHVDKIETAAQRAADLCRQMLAYAGKDRPVQACIQIGPVVNEIMKMLGSGIDKNVAVEVELGHDVPEIMANSSQIQQIVMNLAINASEAIGCMPGTIRVMLGRKVVTPGQEEFDFQGKALPCGVYACLEISDSGCGMNEETCRRIFEPFYTTKFTGRGLGMSATLGIINAHTGAVQFSSTPGAGTTFRVFFPSAAPQTEIKPMAPASSHIEASDNKSGVILLVDDEECLRDIGTAHLQSLGFSVISASNGREALEVFRRHGSSINLIMMDMTMPVMGGREAYLEIRRQHSSLPIVICSGHGLEGFAKSVAHDSRAGILPKPYTSGQLQNVLATFL